MWCLEYLRMCQAVGLVRVVRKGIVCLWGGRALEEEMGRASRMSEVQENVRGRTKPSIRAPETLCENRAHPSQGVTIMDT